MLDKKEETGWTKLKGKIYRSDFRINKCTCGEISTQDVYYSFGIGKNYKKPIKTVALAMCKCGNIFMAILPKDLT